MSALASALVHYSFVFVEYVVVCALVIYCCWCTLCLPVLYIDYLYVTQVHLFSIFITVRRNYNTLSINQRAYHCVL
jgi:hypothetical protein